MVCGGIGLESMWANVPVVSAINKLADEFMVQFRSEQFVMLILLIDGESSLLVVMVGLLARKRRH